MRKALYTALIILMLVSFSAAAAAGETPAVDYMEISLLPEYDQPGVLVIYVIQFDSDSPYPADISIPLPAHVGSPHALAYLNTNSQLVSMPYERTVSGGTAYLTFNSPSPVIQIEYYDPNLIDIDSQNSFEFSTAFEQPIAELRIEILQPIGAVNFQSIPAMNMGEVDQQGLVHYETSLGAFSADQPIILQLGYEKKSDTLVVDPTSPPEIGQNLLWALTGSIVSAAVILSFFWFRNRRISSEGILPTEIIAQCSVCKRTIRKDEQFCAQCGTQIEISPQNKSAAGADAELLKQLSKREIQVIQLIGSGLTSSEIGETLEISPKTVSRHRERLTQKLDLTSTAELIRFGIRAGIIDP